MQETHDLPQVLAAGRVSGVHVRFPGEVEPQAARGLALRHDRVHLAHPALRVVDVRADGRADAVHDDLLVERLVLLREEVLLLSEPLREGVALRVGALFAAAAHGQYELARGGLPQRLPVLGEEHRSGRVIRCQRRGCAEPRGQRERRLRRLQDEPVLREHALAFLIGVAHAGEPLGKRGRIAAFLRFCERRDALWREFLCRQERIGALRLDELFRRCRELAAFRARAREAL